VEHVTSPPFYTIRRGMRARLRENGITPFPFRTTINDFKKLYRFNFQFYTLTFREKVCFGRSFGTVAAVNGPNFIPLVFLLFQAAKKMEAASAEGL
jgi:hypothetical protein